MPEYNYPTCARVDFVVQNNATFGDAIQFDPPPWGFTGATGCTGPNWNLSGMSFRMDIKRTHNSPSPLMSIGVGATGIIVQDPNQRIISFNVPEANIQAALTPGEYIFDFVMISSDAPPVRTPLMFGNFIVRDGVSGG
jgi:hypothetical protein